MCKELFPPPSHSDLEGETVLCSGYERHRFEIWHIFRSCRLIRLLSPVSWSELMKTREVYSSSSDVLDKDSARLFGREKANAVPSELFESAPMPEIARRVSSFASCTRSIRRPLVLAFFKAGVANISTWAFRGTCDLILQEFHFQRGACNWLTVFP